MGIGDWGLGIGDWGLARHGTPESFSRPASSIPHRNSISRAGQCSFHGIWKSLRPAHQYRYRYHPRGLWPPACWQRTHSRGR